MTVRITTYFTMAKSKSTYIRTTQSALTLDKTTLIMTPIRKTVKRMAYLLNGTFEPVSFC
jgi:hypothetical protein